MLSLFLVLTFSAFLLGLALLAKVSYNRKYRHGEQLSSPLAEAITQIVGIAGGIYLALVTAINFLGLVWPEKINIFGSWVDPIAILAIVLACLQPIVLWVWHKS